MATPTSSNQAGLTFIEILVVIGIIAILTTFVLVGVLGSQKRARDTRIKNSVSQLRLIAEIAYDNQGASYKDWTQDSTLQADIVTLRQEIDKNYGDPPGTPYVSVLRESQAGDFCVSAPLSAEPGVHACIDSTGELRQTTSGCPDHPDGGPKLACP